MISPLFSRDIFKVLTVFSVSPGHKFSRNELKEKTRLNNKNLDSALSALQASGVLKKERRMLHADITADLPKRVIGMVSFQYKELKEIPFAAYFSVLDVAAAVSRCRGAKAYLFGSYSKLVFNDRSDIDIAVVSGKLGEKEKALIEKAAGKAKKTYGKTVEVHYFSQDFYRSRKDPLVKEILKGVELV
jgi:predicted nucleotidyltransferase